MTTGSTKPRFAAPPAGISGGRGFAAFKLLVYSALIVNVGLLYAFGTWREVVEQSGWLLILGAFEWESRGLGFAANRRRRAVQIGLQMPGYALAMFSWASYALAEEWLNFTNATLWLLIAAFLAYDLLMPGRYASLGWRLRNFAKTGLYLGVLAVAIAWGLAGDWLDFWDALLWLACFFVIELKIFDFEKRLRRSSPAA